MKQRLAKKTGRLTKRQNWRLYTRYMDHHCQECGQYWNRHENWFFDKYGWCDEICMMHLLVCQNMICGVNNENS
ncbi:hypothetical protein K3F51_04010 [Limosilactobacillus reuteri]|uniref:hypothetical protein n=1 Tax=Limosilactobacillus reuteri TaxID=1598 RepID=UPI001CBAC4C9|nr:hypothetical protein [Limosilactobacillus reuteri]UAW61098.1 hypothetical protein K3F51_04010 [Limosilactobacillus reuteri]